MRLQLGQGAEAYQLDSLHAFLVPASVAKKSAIVILAHL